VVTDFGISVFYFGRGCAKLVEPAGLTVFDESIRQNNWYMACKGVRDEKNLSLSISYLRVAIVC